MIEAPEFVTPTQRELHNRYVDIHRRFFPSPPPYKPKPSPAVAPIPVVVQPNPLPIMPTKVIPIEATNLRLKIIRRTVCRFYNISEDAVRSTRRTQEIVMPRHMISYLAAKFTKASTPMIGRLLGGQDHTTILHAIKGTRLRVRNNRTVWEQALRLEAALRQQFGDTTAPRNCIGRYVVHERVLDYFKLGWMWAANLNEYAALLIWPCGCECVEPRE